MQPPPSGIILDLRGNRGGLLREAVEAANLLLPSGVVTYTAGRDPDADHVWRSEPGEIAAGVPVVLAIDGRTASAAEILAAALTDRGRAVAVGSATLGKGLVQTIAPLPDGGELFVTWSRVLAPRGWPLQGLGVMPQVCTSLGEADLARQLAALAEGEQPMQHAIDAERLARAPLTPERIVAIRNACPAAEGREADLTDGPCADREPCGLRRRPAAAVPAGGGAVGALSLAITVIARSTVVTVIARSEATKQSRSRSGSIFRAPLDRDCFVASLLAMTVTADS